MITESSFKAAIRRLNPPDRIAVALSGGADSTCLAYLLSKHFKGSILGITVDHQLRPESALEAQKVRDFAHKIGIEHVTVKLGWNCFKTHDFESEARRKRYQALCTVCEKQSLTALFTAHHRDDQLETFLMRRSGARDDNRVFGESAMRPVAPLGISKVSVYRPLLAFSKKEIYVTCRDASLEYIEDPSNREASVTTRNRVRQDIARMGAEERENLEIEYQNVAEKAKQYLDMTSRLEEQLISRRSINRDFILGSLDLKIDFEVFLDTPAPVFNRLVYNQLYSLSSTSHYHYKFLRLNRLYQSTLNYINNKNERSKNERRSESEKRSNNENRYDIKSNIKRNSVVVYQAMNLTFSACHIANTLYLHAKRQKPIRSTEPVRVENGKWVCFDNRLMFRFRWTGDLKKVQMRFPEKNEVERIERQMELSSSLKKVVKLAREYRCCVVEEQMRVLGIPGVVMFDEDVDVEIATLSGEQIRW